MTNDSTPTVYEWAGGSEALNHLTVIFYDKVLKDPLLKDVFEKMDKDHPQHVAMFLSEVFGGPKTYSKERGGHPHMLSQHLNRHLTKEQRKQWETLLLESADEMGLPDDPEFRSAFVGYLEWGSRLAVINSQPGASVDPNAPMPAWGWGEVGGPYPPKKKS